MKTNRALVFSLLAAAALLPPSFLLAQEEISPSALQQIEALMAEKETRTPAEQKMDSQLVYLSAQQQGQPVANGVPSLIPSVELTEGNLVLVDISGGVSKGLVDAITEAGGAVVNQFAPFDAIRAKVPVGALETLAGRADVRSISPAAQAITNMGTVVSEADRTHRASTARANLGVTGNGVKIGVLSDGVNSLGTSINNGNINANAVVIPGQAGSGDEGTAMMELIQDLVPGAQLYFATAFSGNASFASNILALQAAGCTIIVDDVSYFNESPFQDQVIAQAVKTVSDAGVLYFSSAGNSGNKNDGTSGTWEGDFVSGGAVAAPVTGTGTLLDFGGATTFNTVTSGGSSRRVDLFWSDPDLASANDYDLFVLDSTGASVLRSSTNLQTGTQSPYEAVSTLNIGERIVVVKRAGAADRFLQLTTGRARLTISTSGVVRGHNASGAANAFCVAATNVANSPSPSVFVGGGTNPVETFSSDGPRRIFFQANGTPLTAGNFSSTGGQVLSKPDITAADGTVTTVTGFTTFFGTSAAAPHAAAIAALLKSYKPSLTPAQIRTAMTSTALDIEVPGSDRDSGAGIVMAEPALAFVGAPDAMTVSSSGDLNASGPAGGPFVPTSVSYTVTNTSGAPLNWAAFKTRPWVSISPNGGFLAPAASAVVTCSINAGAAAALPVGAYSDVVTLTNLTSAYSRKLDVNLVVTTTIPAITSAAAYDNTTTYSGSVFFNNLATSTAVGTRMVVDDITFAAGSAGKNVTNFVWAIGNNDTVSFTARPIVRFWAPDGPGGGPGTLIGGYTFNPLTLAVGGSSWNFSPPAGELVIPAGNKIWAGLAFDGVGATATVANLNNLFQYIYSPPTVGSSADTMFLCTNLGANTVNNPAGSTSNFGGTPAANFYWQFSVSNTPPTVATAEPAQVLSTSARLGGIVLSGGGEGVTERGIVWGAAANPTTANNKSIMGSGTGAYSAVVTGLPATSTIHIRAYAITGVGTAYGPDITLAMPGSNSSLSSLVLTTATLSPVFASGTFSYIASVPNSTSALTVTPTAADATAAITVNGVPVASGGTSGSIPLSVGLNTITTICTAPDTSSTKTYTVDVTRAAPAPEIAVFTGGNTLPGNERTDNTGTHDFGSVNTGSSSAAQTFTIQNTGTANLSLGAVTLGGTDPTQFSVTQPVSTTLATNATTTFTVTFSPTAAGSKSAVVNIASNDGDENPFRINVSGAGSIPSATPVGWWKFDEGSGATALDSGALPANNGVMTSVPYVTDRVVGSHAASFISGSSSRVEVADEASLNPTTGLSLTAWFKATSWPGNNRIIQKGGFGDDQYRITAEGGVFRCDLRTATSSTVRVDLPLPSTGVWHHVALTYDAAAGMRVYLDGVLAGSNLGAFGPVNVTTNALTIGTKPAGFPSDTFNGLLDDVRLYNVPLSAADVTGFYPEIVVYDGSGTGGSQRTDNVGTVAFGSVNTGGSSAAQTFTIQNTGAADLTLGTVTLGGTDPTEFSVTQPASTTLAANATATFTVTFSPTTTGAKSAVVNIASNDGDENPFEINVGGAGISYEDRLPGNGYSVTELFGLFQWGNTDWNLLSTYGNLTAADIPAVQTRLSDGYTFSPPNGPINGIYTYPSGYRYLGFTSSSGPLTIRSVSFISSRNTNNSTQLGIDYFNGTTWVNAVTTTSGSLGIVTSSTAQTKTITLPAPITTTQFRFVWNGDQVSMHEFWISALASASSAEIAVEQPVGTNLNDNAATIAFGTADVGVPVTQTFRIKNTGSGPLSITGITFDGSTPGDFSVTTAPVSPVAASIGQTDFVVTFKPLQSGARAAVMHIASDDADENPFDITLTGNGTTFTGGTWAGTPALITIPPNGSFVATGLNFDTDLGFVPTPNQSYTFINIQGVPPAGIIGNFNDLPDGGVVAMAFNGVIYYFQVDYTAGTDGNDLVLTNFTPGTAMWKWLAGPSSRNGAGIYGNVNVASASNNPGARQGAMNWLGQDGSLWMFGGYGYATAVTSPPRYLNDLWQYDRTIGNWIWRKGNNTPNNFGVYGTITVEAAANSPGSRHTGTTWTDASGNLWLFGGFGVGTTPGAASLNDLWRYNRSTGNWTWMKGSTVTGAAATYGTLGVAAAANTPGARSSAAGVYRDGNLWLFGGYTGTSYYNDVWRFEIATGNWAWMGGSNTPNQNGVYGTQGAASASNIPGARRDATAWLAKDGLIWFFGGLGLPATGTVAGDLNDLWSYNPATGEWAWMKGSTTTGADGVYGTIDTPAAGNTPGSRSAGSGWVTVDGDFWLVGGFKNSRLTFNDVWIYDVASNQWTWKQGAAGTLSVPGVYGTKGVAAAANQPGGRFTPSTWVTLNGSLWIFGGGGADSFGNTGRMSDLWTHAIPSPSGTPYQDAMPDDFPDSLIVNAAPSASDATAGTVAYVPVSGQLSGMDADGDRILFSAAGATTISQGTLTLNEDGTWTYTPANGFTGVATFQFKAADNYGGQSGVSTLVISVSTNPADSDGDGMADEFERRVWGDLASADADGDADLDGQSNYFEFLAGTSPLDSGERLGTSPTVSGMSGRNGSVQLQLNHVRPGVNYHLETSVDLEVWSRIGTFTFDAPGGATIEDPVPSTGVPKFYRMSLEATPAVILP